MKKIYVLLMALGLGTVANAQFNLGITLDNYTAGASTSDDPLDLAFTITNNGSSAIATGDSIYWSYLIGTETYSTQSLAAGYVTYTVLTAPLAAGASFQIAGNTSMTMDWIYDKQGAAPGDVCAVVWGVNVNAAAAPTDSDPTDNEECVSYDVTAVAGLDAVDLSQISVYPNPAADVVNFNFGNNQLDNVNILDISGRIVDVITVNESVESLSLNTYENGVYFYQIVKNNEVITTSKFVVSK